MFAARAGMWFAVHLHGCKVRGVGMNGVFHTSWWPTFWFPGSLFPPGSFSWSMFHIVSQSSPWCIETVFSKGLLKIFFLCFLSQEIDFNKFKPVMLAALRSLILVVRRKLSYMLNWVNPICFCTCSDACSKWVGSVQNRNRLTTIGGCTNRQSGQSQSSMEIPIYKPPSRDDGGLTTA